jgi:hypothetical protein
VEFGFIGIGSTVNKLERLGRWELGKFIVNREIFVVSVLSNVTIRSVVRCGGTYRDMLQRIKGTI